MTELKKYESPEAEIVNIKTEALMLWSGQHQTAPSEYEPTTFEEEEIIEP